MHKHLIGHLESLAEQIRISEIRPEHMQLALSLAQAGDDALVCYHLGATAAKCDAKCGDVEFSSLALELGMLAGMIQGEMVSDK